MGTAGFDREEDVWPRRWAEAYVAFAAGEKRGWLRAMGHRIFPLVGWAARGGFEGPGPGEFVPPVPVGWGTRPRALGALPRRGGAAPQGRAGARLGPPPPRDRP